MKRRVLIVALCAAVIAFAAETEFSASKDAYVSENDPATNYGADYFLNVWGGSDMPPTPDQMILVEFSSINEIIAAGGKIDSAAIKLYVTTHLADGEVFIYQIGDEWAEMNVTWNTRPDSNKAIVAAGMLPAAQGVWFETTVTDIVNFWVDNVYPVHNLGFYVVAPLTGPGVQIGAQFSSRENLIDNPPKLFVSYHFGGAVEEEAFNSTLDVHPVSQAATLIRFLLPEAMQVSLKVYDACGALVGTLIDGCLTSGSHGCAWSAERAGVYFVRLAAGDKMVSRKIVVIN